MVKNKMEKDNNINDDHKFTLLLKEYEILVDLIKHQTDRITSFNRTFLTVNSIIVGAIIYYLKPLNEKLDFFLLLPIVGGLISFLWFCGVTRMKLDSKLRFYQLRCAEVRLKRGKNGIFISGYEFFFGKGKFECPYDKEVSLDFPKCIFSFLAKIPVNCGFQILALLFFGIYIFFCFYKQGIIN